MSTKHTFFAHKAKLAACLVAASSLFLSACSDDDDDPIVCSGTITEIADCNASFDTLTAALESEGLDATLNGGEFTVFAPTDAAFAELFADLGVTAEEFLARDDVADILTYHVLAGSVDAAAATTLAQSMNPTATTVQTSTITLSLNDGDLFVNRSQVTSADVEADNGLIHVINKVLIPPNTFNVVETAQTDGRFDTLVAAVVEADLVDTLATTPNLTVFAPTDDAFADLLTDLNLTAAELLALPNLADILTYHVLDSEIDSTTAVGAAPTTLDPLSATADLGVSYVDPTLFINTSEVIVADVDTSNGVIHAIDKVLIPAEADELSDTGTTIAGLVTALAGASEPEFTTLLAALQQEGLATTLTGAGPFTVFAPTDAAFAAVGDQATILGLANLSDILLQHVVSGNIDSITAYTANGASVTSLETSELDINITDGILMVENANVVITDVETSNGVIHVIDAVIVDPSAQ